MKPRLSSITSPKGSITHALSSDPLLPVPSGKLRASRHGSLTYSTAHVVAKASSPKHSEENSIAAQIKKKVTLMVSVVIEDDNDDLCGEMSSSSLFKQSPMSPSTDGAFEENSLFCGFGQRARTPSILSTPSLRSSKSGSFVIHDGDHASTVVEKHRRKIMEEQKRVEEDASRREEKRENATKDRVEKALREHNEQRSKFWVQMLASIAPVYLMHQKSRKLVALWRLQFHFLPMLIRKVRCWRRRALRLRYTNINSYDMEKPGVFVMQRHQFFLGWGDSNLLALVDAMVPLCLAAGDNVVLEGDWGNEMYMLDSGEVEVFIRKRNESSKKRTLDNGVVVATLLAPSFFGEFALLCDEPRSATIRCKTDVRLWVISRESFKKQLDTLPEESRAKLISMAELRRVDNLQKLYKIKAEHIAHHKLFEGWDHTVLEGMLEHAKAKIVRQGQTIFQQGQKGDHLYFIADGAVAIIKQKAERNPFVVTPPDFDLDPNAMKDLSGDITQGGTVLAKLTKGDMFGEIALLFLEARSATAVAIETCELWYIPKDAVIEVMMANPGRFLAAKNYLNEVRAERLTRLSLQAIQSNMFLSAALPVKMLRDIQAAVTPVVVGATEVLVNTGSEADVCYFVQTGTLKDKGVVLGPGQAVGALELLSEETCNWSHTFRAVSRCDLWVISRENFETLLAQYPEAKKRIYTKEFQNRIKACMASPLHVVTEDLFPGDNSHLRLKREVSITVTGSPRSPAGVHKTASILSPTPGGSSRKTSLERSPKGSPKGSPSFDFATPGDRKGSLESSGCGSPKVSPLVKRTMSLRKGSERSSSPIVRTK